MMIRPSGLFVVAVSFLALIVCTGCGGGNPNLSRVTGTVTLDGQPLAEAEVTFTPTGAEGGSATGVTDANGKYELAYSADSRGAWIGTCEVSISKIVGALDKESLPAKYNSESELTAEVGEEGNTFDFALE